MWKLFYHWYDLLRHLKVIKLVMEKITTSYYQTTEVSVSAQYSTKWGEWSWQAEEKITGWQGVTMTRRLKNETVSENILKLRRNGWNLLRTCNLYFLEIYIEWINLKESSTIIFLALSAVKEFYNISTDKVTKKYGFSYHMFFLLFSSLLKG